MNDRHEETGATTAPAHSQPHRLPLGAGLFGLCGRARPAKPVRPRRPRGPASDARDWI